MKHSIGAIIFILIIAISCKSTKINVQPIQGKKWEKITLRFDGPLLSERGAENPFLDYRMEVVFSHANSTLKIPGYFAADGDAAETSATAGRVWHVEFRPDQVGTWTYKVSFRKGKEIAINDDANAGVAIAFDGVSGSVLVSPNPDHEGRLQYVGKRYLQYADSKRYFIKGGCDSPENILGFDGIDGTVRGQSPEERKGEAKANVTLHKFENHLKDYKEGDPSWQDGKGKALIGGLNYLASKGINSLYFLTNNIDGDGKDVYPYTSYDERYRFDCSKLAQWEIIMDHMDDLGIMQHIVLQETENELMLDSGNTETQRKLYYREMIARYAHHPRVTWNLGEENGPVHWRPEGQNTEQQKAMVRYFDAHDAYQNFTVIHSHADKETRDKLFTPLIGLQGLDGMSMQVSQKAAVHNSTMQWIDATKNTNHPWVMTIDEIGPWYRGVDPDDRVDNNQDTVRAEALWGNLMAGGAGAEWYFGAKNHSNDLNCEDWRTRDRMWEYTTHARQFFEQHVPFSDMNPYTQLATGDASYCFAQPGEIYVIYLLYGGQNVLNLEGQPGTYSVQWYNPRDGGALRKTDIDTVRGATQAILGMPPNDVDKDWAILVKRI